jgi:hypothetical protein
MTARTAKDLQPSSMTALEPHALAANGATKQPPPAGFTGQGTILLVEDEESLRSLIGTWPALAR